MEMDINDPNQFLVLNKQGIIPGPEETFKSFYQRAQYCFSLKDEKADFFEKSVQFVSEQLPRLDLYDLASNWVPVCYCNQHLSIWQGGSAWIFQKDQTAPKGALIQLRSVFSRRHKLYFYDKEELLLHELCHVGRLAFEEPKFEEFLAYRTSKSSFRRFFGPIINSPKEALCFMMVLCGIVFLEMMALFLGDFSFYLAVSWLKLIPAFLLMSAFFRLIWRHRQLNRSELQLQALTGSKQLANAILYRLTDAEILAFSKMTPSEIRTYALKQTSPRWVVIRQAYLQS